MAIGIPGVNEENLYALFEDDMELYISALSSFLVNTPMALNKLRNVSQETLQDYSICVHGIKGTCASICAEEARKKALELEMMSKNGDLPGVLAANEIFLKYMENLLDNLQKWLKNYES